MEEQTYTMYMPRNYSTGRTIGHAQNTGSSMFEGKVFVGPLKWCWKAHEKDEYLKSKLTLTKYSTTYQHLPFFSKNAFATSTIMIGKISTLTHEFGDNSMKTTTLVSKAILMRAQRPKVFGRLGDYIPSQFHNDTTGIFLANGNIKIDLGIGTFGRNLGTLGQGSTGSTTHDDDC